MTPTYLTYLINFMLKLGKRKEKSPKEGEFLFYSLNDRKTTYKTKKLKTKLLSFL